MGANALISSPTKIAVIAKDLVSRGITLLFKPMIKSPSRSGGFMVLGSDIVDVVNGHKLGIIFSTTSTDISTIGIESIIPISLPSFRTSLEALFMALRIMLVPILFTLIRMVDKKLASAFASFLRVFPVILFRPIFTMFILVIPYLTTSSAI